MNSTASRTRLGIVVASVVLTGGVGSGLAAAHAGAPAAGGERIGSAAVSAQAAARHDTAGTDTNAAKKCPRGAEFVKFRHGWTAGYSRTMSALVGGGSQGKHVAEAQCLLAGWGYKPGAVDGVYGSSTKAAVKAYQGKVGLGKDGVVGKSTWKKLRVTSGR